MSLNIGTPAVEAAKRLQGSEDWRTIRQGVAEMARSRMNIALDGGSANAAENLGYARALRDVYLAFESATHGTPMQRVEKPSPVAGKGEK